jgi:hypothetical protein
MNIKFNFNKIYIIESLFSNDLNTGRNLYNDLIRWKTLEEAPLYSEFIEVQDLTSFSQVMERINCEVKNGFFPFLHFEIHGSSNKDGVVLRSGELVSWKDMSKLTREINISTKNNLIISLATCFGAFFLNSIDINKFAPFSGCVSTIETITTSEVEQDFSAFFETILTTTNFNLAVDKLNKGNNNPNKYHFFSAEEFLEMVLNKLEDEHFNSKSMQHRNWVNSLTKRVRLEAPEYAQMKKGKVKEIIRRRLLYQKSTLRAEARKSFIAFDL